MRTIDLLNPAAQDHGKVPLEGSCVISSIAGIGDLFIHLPLIEGIVTEVRRRGGQPSVALRPPHAAIGRACGWDVFEFENPIQDLFGGTVGRKIVASMFQDFRDMRARKPDLWLDLTGNAFNALNLRMLGVKKLASRVTRGGRSLVHHRLPNEPFENEYANRQRLAEHLGCHIDLSVYSRLSLRKPKGHVVLGISTNCQWKNWPLSRFADVVRNFPEHSFILTGLRREIVHAWESDLKVLAALPNVTDRLDRLTLTELLDVIATADAVVTNDTSTAHIANAWNVPGAVIFGPVVSEQWAGSQSLRIFHDRSCQHYPCVAWRCATPDNWCMEKVSSSAVAEHLASILSKTEDEPPLKTI